MTGQERRDRLAAARLYLVCGPISPQRLSELLPAAVAGGVDIVQLREKQLDDQQILQRAAVARTLCDELGVLFIVNDRPDLAQAAEADGVHVGQDDMPVATVREQLGDDMLIGLSTHSPAQLDAPAAARADYVAVGPVYETPTKPGRPAVGLELVRYAAAHAPSSFFAIGGLDGSTLGPAIDAGARRAVVLRAIADSPDPRSAARALADLLDAAPLSP